jgi:hypothetical protein
MSRKSPVRDSASRKPTEQSIDGEKHTVSRKPTTLVKNLHRTVGNQTLGRILQAKFRVSNPGDVHEREADRVAAEVMRAPDLPGAVEVTSRASSGSSVDRACGECEASSSLPASGEDSRDELQVFAKGETSAGATTAGGEAHLVTDGLDRGGGKPLGDRERSYFEPRFARDFGDIRVHADGEAARSAHSIDALAYTVGRDIVFGEGQYRPETQAGSTLLAHELTHVVQQGHGEPTTASRQIEIQALSSEATISRQPASSAPASVPSSAPAATTTPAAPPALNYDMLADRIRKAIEGLGTDEEQVYLALQQLQRNDAAIRELERVYMSKFNLDLEADIRDDFSDEELEYALQLMNRGTPGAAQTIGTTPSTAAHFERAARRLRNAVDRWGTDEEAIYAVLLPFNRDMRLIRELMRVYDSLYNENLRERIISETSWSEQDYALYLLGGSAVRANIEITEVTEAEAVRLFSEMASLGFWTSSDTQAPIPYHHPPDGCYARAHLMVQRMTELGYASEKIFAVAGRGLEVRTDFAGDQFAMGQTPVSDPRCAGGEFGSQTAPVVRWWYHVAPTIHVRNATGVVTEMVIDPSTATAPITIAQWTAQMRGEPFDRRTVGQIESLLKESRGIFPTAQNITFSTDRDVFWPIGPFGAEEPLAASEAMEGVRAQITHYAERATAHELAAAIRPQLRASSIDVALVLAAISAATPAARAGLSRCFPNLLEAFRSRLSSTDMLSIVTALGP